MLYLLCLLSLFCYPKQYLGGHKLDKNAVIGMSIDKLCDQYIICQSSTDENIYYSYYISYSISGFFNRKRIKESKIYVLTVKNDSVIDLKEVNAMNLYTKLKRAGITVREPWHRQSVFKLMIRDFQSVM